MKVETAARERLEDWLWQYQPVSDDNSSVRFMRSHRNREFLILESLRRGGWQTEPFGFACDRAWPQLQPTPKRLRRARVDCDDLMPGVDNPQKRRHGEI